MDKILWQKISGQIEYHYLSLETGEIYSGVGYDHVDAQRDLFRKLGWPKSRLKNVKFIRF